MEFRSRSTGSLPLRPGHHHRAGVSRTKWWAFPGGKKYLFPGVSGPQVLNFFHWLGAVVTNPMIIGNQWTPGQEDRGSGGGMVDGRQALLLPGRRWQQTIGRFIRRHAGRRLGPASELSRQIHITHKDRPFPHHSLLRSADVRRTMDRRKMHVQTGARACGRGRANHLCAAPCGRSASATGTISKRLDTIAGTIS